MNEIKKKIYEFLNEQLEEVSKETDKDKKIDKMTIILRFKKITDNYEELEPILEKYFAEKADKERFEKEKD
jgi:uncharacterized protein (DUF1810 family)